MLVGLVAVYALLIGYDVISSSGTLGTNPAAPAANPAPAAVSRPGASPPPAKATPVPPRTPAAYPLGVVSVAAFGPEETSDGDNPGIAFRILDGSSDLPCYSQWYSHPSSAFTRLPPDGHGHYQVSVYNATVDGTAGT